ncbi:hypothetical protein N9N67_02425 [Bacteriovoracaceae bacterium]|nr:hypothetical protein [Bacteriovoracaceae bacterium]
MKKKSLGQLGQFLLLFLCFLFSSQSVFSQIDYPEKKAVGVHINGDGFKKIQQNLIPLIMNYGINISHHFEKNFVYTLDPMSIDQLAPTEELGDIFVSIRDNLEKYFEGLVLKDHHFRATLSNMSISAIWKNINFKKDLDYNLKGNEIIKGSFVFRTNNITLQVEDAKIEDLGNPLLKSVGFNNFIVELDASTDLYVSIPVTFNRVNGDEITVKVGQPYTNLHKIQILANYEPPIKFPYIALKIEEDEYPLKREIIEQDINEHKESILTELNAKLNENFKKLAPEFLQKYITDMFSGHIRDQGQVQPPGSPADLFETPIEWGISLADIDSKKKNLELYFNGLVKDFTMTKPFPLLSYPFRGNGKIDHVNVDLENHDLTFIFDIGFINQFIYTGYHRGHLSRYLVDEKNNEYIYFEESPKIYVDENGKLKIACRAHSITRGLDRMGAKPKVHFNFELFVNFRMKADGKVSFYIESVDLDALTWDDSDLKKPFKWKGRKTLKNKFKDFQKMITDLHAKGDPPELSDEIPVPPELFGIDFDIKSVSIDPNGYILIYTNFKNL